MTSPSAALLLVVAALAAAPGCGGAAGHRVALEAKSSPGDPAVAVIGAEDGAGIEPFVGLYDGSGRRVQPASVPPGTYQLRVSPPCGRSSEKTVEIRGPRTLEVTVPPVAAQTRWVRRELVAPELRHAANGKTLTIAADTEVSMLRPWPLKPPGDGFSTATDCIGALVKLTDPPGPKGEFYIVPRSALRDTPTEPVKGVLGDPAGEDSPAGATPDDPGADSAPDTEGL